MFDHSSYILREDGLTKPQNYTSFLTHKDRVLKPGPPEVPRFPQSVPRWCQHSAGMCREKAWPELGPDFENTKPTFPTFIFSSFDPRKIA